MPKPAINAQPISGKYKSLLRQFAFHAIAALSLALCIASACLWVGSRRGVSFYRQSWTLAGSNATEWEKWLFSLDGQIGVAHRNNTTAFSNSELSGYLYDAAVPRFEWYDGSPYASSGLNVPAFDALTHGIPMGIIPVQAVLNRNYQERTVPAFLPTAIFAVIPLFWIKRHPPRRSPGWIDFLLSHSIASYVVFAAFYFCADLPIHVYNPHYFFLALEEVVNRQFDIRSLLLCVSYVISFFAVLKFTTCFGPKPKPGMCPNCGYDLRASKDRCPECGIPMSTEATANYPENIQPSPDAGV